MEHDGSQVHAGFTIPAVIYHYDVWSDLCLVMLVLRLHVDLPGEFLVRAGGECAEYVHTWLRHKDNFFFHEKTKKAPGKVLSGNSQEGKKEQNNFFLPLGQIQIPTPCTVFFPFSLMDNLKMAQLEIFHVSRKSPGISEDM